MSQSNAEPAKSNQPKKRKRWITPKNVPYLFILPAVTFFLIFTVYPVISSLLLSFQKREGSGYVFAGLENYIRLFQDGLFYKALGNTFLILLIQVPIQLFLAVIIAVALNSQLVKMKSFFRIAFFMPAITALVASSIIFMIMLDENYGLINYLLSFVGVEPIAWLSDPFWAKVALMVAITWRWTGYNMVIFLAGLQNIPGSLYEAAEMDGASKLKQFFYITIPQLKPIFLFTFVLSTIGTLQLFDEPYILTEGGPNNSTLTITLYLYQNGFRYFDFGYASAIAYVLVLIIGVLSWAQMKWAGEDK
ncbi:MULTISPECIES: carbohydrate ABC transporter permease [Halobacillus]|uniref:ABC-type transport system permease protein (Probable substrate sugar/lactose/L-arabinose) n=1 Tax=Halobacillus halophilus (strain ATCC 35676 / DSM 2266 / JCM 20832 / KCTC 3685 / LMG 17431 / NBRC 102448 / NCIMB 2269) TaxID=866895 RepID=I0JRV5_HALH3|nr:sugar ABC transporter permease [Halobacillus halophilus]CCG46876.1 ABC-type transport system permease protein (probable substrate sugar/lactose/L-arabinose) [Halobacillus halophilus DSM 2266]